LTNATKNQEVQFIRLKLYELEIEIRRLGNHIKLVYMTEDLINSSTDIFNIFGF